MNELNNLPLSPKDQRALYKAIRELPPTRQWECPECGKDAECSSLAIYYECPTCGQKCKLRHFSAATDLQDFLLIALQWFQDAGLEVPKELLPLVDGDWEDWDEYFGYETDETE